MYEYIGERQLFQKGSKKPESFAFPKYMLRAPVSQTAKMIYMLLLDRAMDKKSRDRIVLKDGKIRVVYMMKDLANDCGRGLTVIKDAVHELENAGLVKKYGFQGAKSEFCVYVKYPYDEDY